MQRGRAFPLGARKRSLKRFLEGFSVPCQNKVLGGLKQQSSLVGLLQALGSLTLNPLGVSRAQNSLAVQLLWPFSSPAEKLVFQGWVMGVEGMDRCLSVPTGSHSR